MAEEKLRTNQNLQGNTSSVQNDINDWIVKTNDGLIKVVLV